MTWSPGMQLALFALFILSCAPSRTASPNEILQDSQAPCETNVDCSLTSIPAVATNCCPTCNVRPIPRDELVELAQWCAGAKKAETCEQLACQPSGSHRIRAACVRGQCVTVAVD